MSKKTNHTDGERGKRQAERGERERNKCLKMDTEDTKNLQNQR